MKLERNSPIKKNKFKKSPFVFKKNDGKHFTIRFKHKNKKYEIRFFKKNNNEFSIKFGLIKNNRISYKQTNFFNQYDILNILIDKITNFLYNNTFDVVEYKIQNTKMNNVNEYILKKLLPIGLLYDITENPSGVFKTIIKNDEVFLNLIAELNEDDITK